MTEVQNVNLDAASKQSPDKSQQEDEYQKLITSLPTRWEIELEFVQSLSNIPYVNYLAQNNYLQDPSFINYLKYLEYWSEPEYSKYLVYPNCLHILKLLLLLEQFRRDIVNPEVMNTLMNDMVKKWQLVDQVEKAELNEQGIVSSSETVKEVADIPPLNNGNGGPTIVVNNSEESKNVENPQIIVEEEEKEKEKEEAEKRAKKKAEEKSNGTEALDPVSAEDVQMQ